MKRLTAYLALLLPLIAKAEPLDVQSSAPAQTVTIETGESLDLGVLYNHGPVLVYFYPKAYTPGCTKQACNLRDAFAELQSKGLTILGVSTDDIATQKAFKEKYNLPFHLVADTNKELASGFQVDTRFGFTKRQSFLIINGVIVWRDLSATPSTQAADALAALEGQL